MIKEAYYWMYKGLQKIRKDENPAVDAFLGIVFFQNLNLIVLGRILFCIFHFRIAKDLVLMWTILGAIIIISLNYFITYHRRKDIFQIVEQYSKDRRRKGKFFFILYIIASLVAFYSVTLGLIK
ncbi:hypothetical protein [Solitalea canadensis]|uniref:Uncharacterized protein n=1 Tax=Solitalea canadensis (strain ATCC 29591 / DSM 3403 / JCM 21819 / LMG 8368 / NBRC 15130 / NCIMB 12057 / USAM 9D) TaxID=929556 RepID=H8KRI8_SOLCM|nr:hypothetical protein [Solitalea canadensis]AFD07513.1 hypothetical protein Solca_2474 [Solitalea canadensis DSM 3403]